MDEKETLNQFGEMLISDVRTQTITQLDKIFSGELKSERAQKLHAKLSHFSPQDIEVIREITTEAIDRSLFKVMFMFESSGDFIIGAVNEDEIVDLNDISDGLGGEYFGWVEKYSKPNGSDDE